MDMTRLASRRDRLSLPDLLVGGRPEILTRLADRSPDAIAQLSEQDWDRLAAEVVLPDGTLPVAFAWRRGLSAHLRGRAVDALGVYDLSASTGSDADLSRLASAHAASWWSVGEQDRADEASSRALRLAENAADDGARAAAWIATAVVAATAGDRHGSTAAYHKALRFAHASDDVVSVARIEHHLACAELEEARYEPAVRALSGVIQLCASARFISGEALARVNLAEALLRLGRLDEAAMEAERARVQWSAIDSPLAGAAWRVLGSVHTVRGSLSRAMHSFRESIRRSERQGLAQAAHPARIGLALVLAEADPVRARELLEEAQLDDGVMGAFVADLALGWFLISAADGSAASRIEASALAESALADAHARSDHAGAAEALELAVLAGARDPGDVRLREAEGIWRSTGNQVRLQANHYAQARLTGRRHAEHVADRELRRLGIHDDAWAVPGTLHTVRRTPPDVRVHCLGTFAIHLADRAVASAEWPSRKSRDALKLLALSDGGAVSRSRLTGLLWPEVAEPGNRLSVALSQLRSVLDPLHVYPSDHYVSSDRLSVRLDLDRVHVDCSVFESTATEALASGRPDIDALEAVAARYTGFLLSDEDADWLDAPRDRLHRLSGEVNRALAIALADGDEPLRAVPWLVRQLDDDPYDEPTFATLVRLLTGLGRHGEARRHYATYVARMEELEVPAMTWSDITAPV